MQASQQPTPGIVIVTRQTRLKGMLRRWATAGQAKFVYRKQRGTLEARQGKAQAAQQLEAQAEAEFDAFQREDDDYDQTLDRLRQALDFDIPLHVIDREFLPNFDFRNCSVVVVVGQDGLVANTAKYVGELPIVAVNPDPRRFDGVLLPFQVAEARGAVDKTLRGQAKSRRVTLAQASLADGQRLLAFNDLFIGAASHISARYRLQTSQGTEHHSSSGLIVSTGAGSTGWLSSLVNMANGLTRYFTGGDTPAPRTGRWNWEERKLVWAVREPFASRVSGTSLIAGQISPTDELVVESQMPERGVIFSDGVESDFLEFNDGAIVRISVAEQQAKLVVP